jgi:hypothetical protein
LAVASFDKDHVVLGKGSLDRSQHRSARVQGAALDVFDLRQAEAGRVGEFGVASSRAVRAATGGIPFRAFNRFFAYVVARIGPKAPRALLSSFRFR